VIELLDPHPDELEAPRSASAIVWISETMQVGAALYYGDGAILEIADHVRALAAKYTVREVAFDPWRAGQLAAELEREGLIVFAFPQHDARMVPASAGLHRAIVDRRPTLPDDSELARHATNAIAKHGRRGWRSDKPSPRTQIDGVIALAMALSRAENQPQPAELLGWL
jgi:phage terminase large subunit-like protein